jgi:hypothetical protein
MGSPQAPEKKASPMSMVGFPLLLIPLAIYNIIVFLMRDVSFAAPIVTLPLMSGAALPVTLGDILLALGIMLLLFEVIKGARPGAKYLTDHLLSLIVFAGAAAEFLLRPEFATSIYFLLTLLALVDFLSGVALRARRGTQMAPAGATARRAARKPEIVAEPQFDPAPAPAPSVPGPTVPGPTVPGPSMPAAAAVAASVLRDDPEPKMLQPSPEVPSPGLQPGNGAPAPDIPPR